MNPLRTASPHPVTRIAFAPDGGTFATAQPHTGITLHDRATGRPLGTGGYPRAGGYSGLVYGDGGRWLAAASAKGLELFDPAGTLLGMHPSAYLKSLLLAAVDDGLVGAQPARLHAITLIGGRTLVRQVWYGDERYCEGLSPDGRLSVWSRNRGERLVLVNTTAGGVVTKLDHPAPPGRPLLPIWPPRRAEPDERVVFAPTGDRLAVCGGNAVTVFAAPDREPEPDDETAPDTAPPPAGILDPVFRLDPPANWPPGEPWLPPVAFTPDGRRLLVRRPGNRIQMWDIGSGSLLTQWSWQLEGVTCLAVAPDGLTAAAGGRFGRVLMWDLE